MGGLARRLRGGVTVVAVAVGAALAAPGRGRAAPVTASSAVAPGSAALQKSIDAAAADVEKAGGELSAAVLDLDGGRWLAGHRRDVAVNPASNAKVVTAAAALDELGPRHRFATLLRGRIRDGKARRLVLAGHGDPTLTVAQLGRLVRVAVQLGLHEVTESILVDQSHFDGQHVPPAFEQQPHEWASFRAPVSAVALERNAITLNVVPRSEGQPARVWFHPPGYVVVQGAVKTTATGSGQRIGWKLEPKGDRLLATLSGTVAEGLPRLRFKRRVDDPTTLAGWTLRHLLKERGVRVPGRVLAVTKAVKAPTIAKVYSPPLAVVLRALGKHSDNFTAEMVFKSLGGEAKGEPAASPDGADVVARWLADRGASQPGTRVVNGSGLFEANHYSPATLVRTLQAAHDSPAFQGDFLSQLATGGIDGTLRYRFSKYRKSAIIRGKTGTLAKVDALTGYVLRAGRPPVAFSFVITGLRAHGSNRRRIDRLVERIVDVAGK